MPAKKKPYSAANTVADAKKQPTPVLKKGSTRSVVNQPSPALKKKKK